MAVNDAATTEIGSTKAEALDFLLITRKWAPAMGGMETWSHKIAEHLGKLGSVEVIALPGQPNGMPPSLTALILFPFTVLRRYFALPAAPARILLGDMAVWPIGLIVMLRGGSPKIMVAAHGTDVAYHRRGGFKGWLYGSYLKLGSRLLPGAAVIANSRATAEVATETGWKNAKVVPLATDMAAGSENSDHDGAILFAGRLVHRKGCRWFVENVLPELPADITLKVAGTGWDASEESVVSHPRVKFLGQLSRDALAREYQKSLCVIVPNIEAENGEYEGFGLVAAEAAAAGGIVLASDHGGLRDAVIDGETGHLLPVEDAKAWTEAVRKVAGWPDEVRLAFQRQATQSASRYYNWDRVAASIAGLMIKSSCAANKHDAHAANQAFGREE